MNRPISVLSVALLVAACGASTGDLGGVATPSPTQQPSIDAPSSEPTPGSTENPVESPVATTGPTTTTGSTTVRAYFVLGSFVDNAGLVPVLREIPKTQAVGAAAMQALLDGPNDNELGARPAMYTNIPDGTRFLGLTIANGTATVNLSKEFESGGGSASALGRLAQVVYTLTQFPTIKSVSFQIDGVPKTVFGADGKTFDRPVLRDDYTDQLPAIFVDRPAWGGALGNPAHVAGVANVFEGMFQARILDGNGRELWGGPPMASCGSGCWGAFALTVGYRITKAGWGTLRVFEWSAKDGSPINTTEYPVWLTP
jgi:germination protein M